MEKSKEYIYGIWKVTTAIDCYSTSTKFLGYYEGYIHNIAFLLADKSDNILYFEKISPLEITESTNTTKSVKVAIEGYNYLYEENKKNIIEEELSKINSIELDINRSREYITLTNKNYDVKAAHEKATIERTNKIMSKLSIDDIDFLVGMGFLNM